MKRKIYLVIALMTSSTIFLLGLQLYWNIQSYKNSARVIKSDMNDGLDKAVNELMDIRRDEFAALYKKWLSDTSMIIITCHYTDTVKSTIFYIRDRHPPFANRIPFAIGLNELKGKLDKITPATRAVFVNGFVTSVLRHDLESGSAYYYTQNLGDSMARAFKDDILNVDQLTTLYTRELHKRGIYNDFRLRLAPYTFRGFSAANEDLSGKSYTTREFKYGFATPQRTIAAAFPAPDWITLQKMKWVILSSLVFVGITLTCFAYTVRTMLSQKRMAELKDDFVNNMTHELKTPVATISIAAEAAQDFNISEASASEYLGIIRYQSGNLTYLIDQILKSMLNEETAIALGKTAVSLTDILTHCVGQYRPQLQGRHASVTLDADEKPIWVIGDAPHLGNSLANLMDNALKYGGDRPVIHLGLHRNGKLAVLQITNEGKGIPEEYQDRVFDRFFRVPTGNIHNVKGYGLGLSYVRAIIQQHQGTIKVTCSSTTTTFTIHLPLARHDNTPDIIA